MSLQLVRVVFQDYAHNVEQFLIEQIQHDFVVGTL